MTRATGSIRWLSLLALGAGHGINPAMGWLFAVALGLQRGSRRAVWGALGPLAVGHALGDRRAVLLAAGVAGLVVPPELLQWTTAVLLVGLGVYRLVRSPPHPVRRDAGEPTRAGALVVPHGVGARRRLDGAAAGPGRSAAGMHMHHLAQASLFGPGQLGWSGTAAALVHTIGYLLVTG